MKPMSDYTVSELKNVMKNAERMHRDDVWSEACRYLAKAEGRPFSDELECAVFVAISAYEAALTRKNGKTTRAGYIRPMIEKIGVIRSLETIVKKKETSVGHNFLISMGLEEFTFAHIVTKFADRFSSEAVENAKFVLSL